MFWRVFFEDLLPYLIGNNVDMKRGEGERERERERGRGMAAVTWYASQPLRYQNA